ncbi:5'-3' exonuclease H3TH domain-containing protein [Aquabacter sp. CN5-332]|uniref:5'-3' exonuclease n=1 Tax=Aquabacter sp. CN5-332 TaxID=3156608 RepID=UPI0032B32021
MSFRPMRSGDHLLLIDGSGLLWRGYHANAKVTRSSDGHPVGAIAGFCGRLWSLLEDRAIAGTTHAAVIFDAGRRNWRHDLSPAYKANRPPAPDEITCQFQAVRDACGALPIPVVEMAGYEADDLIATYTRRAVGAGAAVTIATADKDMMQLVSDADGVCMFDQAKRATIRDEGVFERFGVPPAQVLDVLAICGDAVDNVPGVPGIGAKGAPALVREFGGVEEILSLAAGGSKHKHVLRVAEHADLARLSHRLAALDATVPVTVSLAHFGRVEPDLATFGAFLRHWDLDSVAARICGDASPDEPRRRGEAA